MDKSKLREMVADQLDWGHGKTLDAIVAGLEELFDQVVAQMEEDKRNFNLSPHTH